MARAEFSRNRRRGEIVREAQAGKFEPHAGPDDLEACGGLQVVTRLGIVAGVDLTEPQHREQTRVAIIAVVGAEQCAAGLFDVFGSQIGVALAHVVDFEPLPIAFDARDFPVGCEAERERR